MACTNKNAIKHMERCYSKVTNNFSLYRLNLNFSLSLFLSLDPPLPSISTSLSIPPFPPLFLSLSLHIHISFSLPLSLYSAEYSSASFPFQFEAQLSLGSTVKCDTAWENPVCDTYDRQQGAYCKKLRVLCPDHNREKVSYVPRDNRYHLIFISISGFHTCDVSRYQILSRG